MYTKKYGYNSFPILPVYERISWKNIKKIAMQYWEESGFYELWRIVKNSKVKYIIISTFGSVDKLKTVRTFYHDQTFREIGSGVLIKALSLANISTEARKYKVRSLYTYK